jgi:polyhydroxyalkanoate synthesis regulator phasin
VPSGPRKTGGVPDAVRRAVERTFQSTLGSSPITRERAQELADDVLRRAEESAARAGRGVRQAGQRQREAAAGAAAGVGDRLRDAIAEIRSIGGDELSQLRAEVETLRRRVDELERRLGASGAEARRKPESGGGATASASKSRQAKPRSKP